MFPVRKMISGLVASGFLLFATLCSMPAVVGDLIVDDFSVNFPVIGPSQTGPAQILPIGTRVIRTGANTSTIAPHTVIATPGAGANNHQFELTYTGFNSLLNLETMNNLASFGFSTNTAPSNMIISLRDDLGGLSVYPVTNVTTGISSVSTSAFIGTANLQRINDIRVLVFQTNANASLWVPSSFSFATVPEPASMVLFGLTGVAGVIALRRRRRKLPESQKAVA